MIRLSELKLPLSALPVDARRAADAPTETDDDRQPAPHPEGALRQLAAQALGIAEADIASLHVFKRSFDARKAELLAVYIVDVTLTDPALEAGLLARHADEPAYPGHARHGLAPGRRRRRPICRCARWSSASAPAASLPRWCWRRWASSRSCWSAARPCASAPRTPGACGASACSTPNPTCSSAKAAPAPFRDGKLYSQIKDPRHLGRKVMEEFVKAGAPAEILYEAHPHIGTFKLVKVVENLREQIIALGGEIRFEQRVTDVLIEDGRDGRHLRGLTVLDQATGEVVRAARRPRRAGAGPQRARHLRHAARARRAHGGQAVFHRLSHRAPAGRDRPRPLGPPRRPPAAGRGRLQAGAPRQQRPHGLQLLHVPRRHGGGGHLGAGPRGDQRHEPVLAQRAQRQRRHGGRHRPARLPHRRGRVRGHAGPTATARDDLRAAARHPLAGIVLQRQLESHAYVLGGSNYEAPGQLVGDFIAGKPSSQLGDVLPSYKPGVQLGDLHAALPGYAIDALREALPVFGRKIKGFDTPRCGADRRGNAHLVAAEDGAGATISRASTPAACTRRAKAPATPAASCRPAWTASRSARPWRAACSGWLEGVIPRRQRATESPEKSSKYIAKYDHSTLGMVVFDSMNPQTKAPDDQNERPAGRTRTRGARLSPDVTAAPRCALRSAGAW